jgi:hypothetical protein
MPQCRQQVAQAEFFVGLREQADGDGTRPRTRSLIPPSQNPFLNGGGVALDALDVEAEGVDRRLRLESAADALFELAGIVEQFADGNETDGITVLVEGPRDLVRPGAGAANHPDGESPSTRPQYSRDRFRNQEGSLESVGQGSRLTSSAAIRIQRRLHNCRVADP